MSIRYDEKSNIAYISLAGSPGRVELLAALDETVQKEEYKKGMARLWDFRDTDLSGLSVSAIAAMARYAQQYPPGINDVKVAFVANRALEYGLARMFEAYSTGEKITVSVFGKLEEAESWLAPMVHEATG